MKTHKLRFGFACNSSSVSSLILLKPEVQSESYKRWTKIEDKRDFFAKAMFYQMSGQEEYLDFINKICGTSLTVNDYAYEMNNYLSSERGADSGNAFSFPLDKTGSIHEEFAKEFLEYADKYDISWVSNEDNYCEDAYEIAAEHASLGLNLLRYFPAGIARKDENYWTIFSPANGYKVRMSFDPSSVAPTKSTIPELIDIKLTDYCPYECTFCYQGSTKEGKHVDKENFKGIIDQLYEYGVFEIALGGGEPTLHPDFDEIIEYINKKNIVVNVTTRNMKWIKKYIETLYAGYGEKYSFGYKAPIKAVAISTEDPKLVQDIEIFIRKMSNKGGKYVSDRDIKKHIQFQYIVGVNNKLEEIVKECCINQFRITLLGYKTTNRGSLLRPRKEEWMSVVREYKWGSCIGIDTVLAKECEGLMTKEFDDLLLEKHEGRFSCYIDSVNYTIGPSSFCGAEEMMPFTDLKENFKTITDKS